MTVNITHEEAIKLVNAEKGKEILNLLTPEGPAITMLTLAVALATCVSCACDTDEDSSFTLDELSRMMKNMATQVYDAKISGNLPTTIQ